MYEYMYLLLIIHKTYKYHLQIQFGNNVFVMYEGSYVNFFTFSNLNNIMFYNKKSVYKLRLKLGKINLKYLCEIK